MALNLFKYIAKLKDVFLLFWPLSNNSALAGAKYDDEVYACVAYNFLTSVSSLFSGFNLLGHCSSTMGSNQPTFEEEQQGD